MCGFANLPVSPQSPVTDYFVSNTFSFTGSPGVPQELPICYWPPFFTSSIMARNWVVSIRPKAWSEKWHIRVAHNTPTP